MKKIIFSSLLLVSVIVCFLLYKEHKDDKKNIFTESKNIVKKEPKDRLLESINKNINFLDENKVIKIDGTTDINVSAKQAIIIDALTGTVLLEKNANQRMLPSSMTKMMTSYLIEEKILKKEITHDTEFLVSEKAWAKQGSKMFVPLGQKVKVIDLLRGVIIQSGNDACIVLSEGVSGSEEVFANEMNEKAKEMGLKNTHFKNSSGWPEDGHYSTARDLAILGLRVVLDHPDYYKIYSEKTFTYGVDSKGTPITQGNRNPLLYENLSCDGIKTGHTDDGGYGMVASFLDKNQRYLMVINGLSSIKERANEAKKLLSWAKENFITKEIIKKDEIIEPNALVELGAKKAVPLMAENSISIILPRFYQGKITPKVNITQKLSAPLLKRQIVGEIIVESPMGELKTSLLVKEDVAKASVIKRVTRFVYNKVFGSQG